MTENPRPNEDDRIRDSVLAYLRRVNDPMISRSPEPSTLKLRRVLDSLDMAEFIEHLERAFDIKIADADLLSKNFDTVGSVIRFVGGKARGA